MPIEFDIEVAIFNEVLIVDEVNAIRIRQVQPIGTVQTIEFRSEDGTPDQSRYWHGEARNYLERDTNAKERARRELNEQAKYLLQSGKSNGSWD